MIMSTNLPLLYSMFGLAGTGGYGDLFFSSSFFLGGRVAKKLGTGFLGSILSETLVSKDPKTRRNCITKKIIKTVKAQKCLEISKY